MRQVLCPLFPPARSLCFLASRPKGEQQKKEGNTEVGPVCSLNIVRMLDESKDGNSERNWSVVTATDFSLAPKTQIMGVSDFVFQLETSAGRQVASRQTREGCTQGLGALPFITPSLVSRVDSRVQLTGDTSSDAPQDSEPVDPGDLVGGFFYISNFNSNDAHIQKTFEISKRETLNTYFT